MQLLSSWKVSSEASIASDFLTSYAASKVKNENNAIRNRICEFDKQSQKQLSSLTVIAGWIFASEVSLKSKFGIGLHEVGVRTVSVRTLRHNQIFLLSW